MDTNNNNNRLKFFFESTLPEVSLEKNELTLLVNAAAPPVSSNNRAPIDLVFTVDVSGSMQGEKLKLVKDCLDFILQHLGKDDRISIVSFDSNVTEVLPLQAMTPRNKERASDLVKALRAGSSTNLSGGLLKALEHMQGRADPRDVSCIFLFTDGQANAGLSETDLRIAVGNILPTIPGACQIITFGFGSDHKEDLLKSLADQGKGQYYFIETPEKIPDSFGDAIGGLLSVFAQNIKFTINMEPGCELVQFLNKLPHTKTTNGIEVEYGDLYSEEERNILIKIAVPAVAEPIKDFKVLSLIANYFNIASTQLESDKHTFSVSRATETTAAPISNRLSEQMNRIQVTETLDTARVLSAAGNATEAEARLKQMRDILFNSPATSLNAQMGAEMDEALGEVKLKSDIFRKKAMMRSHAHAGERSVGEGGHYETRAKLSAKEQMSRTTK